MILNLVKLPPLFLGRGIYGKTGDVLPERFAFLHPDSAKLIVQLEADYPGAFRYSDVYRSAEGSLAAIQKYIQAGRTVRAQPPGFSAHNYGLAVDIDVDSTLKRLGKTYADMHDLLEARGIYCHRRDGARGIEDWHHNLIGPGGQDGHAAWGSAVEARIQQLYASQFVMTPTQAQAALKQLDLYHGEVDGAIGPQSRAALGAFQGMYACPQTGQLDARTQRVLAFVTATSTAA